VFVVGCLGGWESAAKVLFESESLSGDIKKGRKSGEEVAGTITARFGNSRNNHEELAPVWPAKTASTLNASFGDKLGLENQHINSGAPLFVPAYAESSFGNFKEDNIAATIRASGGSLSGGSETLYVSDVSATLTASGAGFSRPGHTSTAHENYIAIPIHAQATQYKGGGANRNNDGKGNGLGIGKSGDPMNTLDTSSRHAVATSFNVNARPDEMKFLEEKSNTLTVSQNSGLMQNMAVRRLTEVECERLQGFPDNYTNIKENCPSGARYKALGNSMAVPVMRWIGERINNYERL
jgi:DNA (cytosine-5)-methyltransferase 1